jgi:hypothetical protein
LVCAVASSAESPLPTRVFSTCQVTQNMAHLDGHRVSVSARLIVSEHYVLLADQTCPKGNVFVHGVEGGPDLTFCSDPALSARFGCPADPRRNIVGTFSGLLVVPDKGAPRLYVEKMSDVKEIGAPRGK